MSYSLIFYNRGGLSMNIFKNILNRDSIKVKIIIVHEGLYSAMAFDGVYGVYNCYGTTPEKAREIALLRLKRCVENCEINKIEIY
jgi:hypothetical protein